MLIAYVAYCVFLRDVWIRTQRAAVTSRGATNLATHLPSIFTQIYVLHRRTLILYCSFVQLYMITWL
jgi:hypothetical protein